MTVVRGFFDGRGLKDSSLLVLAALTGESAAWDELQKEWTGRVLSLLDGNPLSVTDCLHKGGGKRLRGVPYERRIGALREAVKILDRWAGHEVMPCSAVIDLEAYRRTEKKRVGLIPAPALCVDHIVPTIDYSYQQAKGFEYFFDQGEPFIRHLREYWNPNPDKRLEGPWFLRRVKILTKASSADYMALQAADVYVWTIYTFCEKSLSSEPQRDVPTELKDLLRQPTNSWFCGYRFLLRSPFAISRVLAQRQPVPNQKVIK